jgi:hypothetical protein
MTFFYNLNKKLDEIRATPETTHKRLDERDMGKHNNATTGFKAVAAKAAKEYGSKAAGERVAGAVKAKMAKAGKLEEELDEGFVDTVKSAAQQALNVLGHGDDDAMIRDLQKKAGVPVTGKVPPAQPGQNPTTAGQPPVAEEGGMPMTAKQKSFAKLAPPEDKITFADKIAGAKKEVDEMLGDVAAEAMKNALRGKQQVADEGNAFTGKLKATPKGSKFKVGGKEFTDTSDIDEGWDDMMKDVKGRMGQMKTGEKVKGHKGEIEKTATGIKHTRSYDAKTGETDSDDDQPTGEKRGRGRPKKANKAPERVTAKATKHKGGRKTNEAEGEGSDLVKLAKVIQSCQSMDQLETARKMAQNFLRKHSSHDSVGFGGIAKDFRRRDAAVSDIERKKKELQGGQELDEKAVSKKQQKFMGMVHATQKGEKAPSKEVAKVAKTMKKSDAEDFASTKHKGLPEKKKPEGKKKEKTEESGTTAGSVAPAAGGKSKGNSLIGKGIYDSINRNLEAMISESMNVSVNMSMDEHGEPRKNITVSAEGEAAEQLAQLLNLAGMAAQQGSDAGCGCETSPCSCDSGVEIDENSPDWPTDQETTGEDDPEMRRWAGGLNGPKSTGQTVGAPFNRQDSRQGVMGEGKDLGMKLYAELKSFKG